MPQLVTTAPAAGLGVGRAASRRPAPRPVTTGNPSAIFCDDNDLIWDETGRVYVEGQFSYAFWRRFLKVFASLTVAARGRRLGQGRSVECLNLSSGPSVSFAFVPNLAGPVRLVKNRAEAVAVLTRSIALADAVIVRLPSLIGLLAVPVAERLAKPWAAEVCGCPWDQFWNFGTWQGKALAPAYMYQMRRVVARAPYVLYVSRKFLQRRYPSRGVTTAVSNVDIDHPEPAVLARRLGRIGGARPRLVLGMIGSIKHRYKGLGTAIEGLARVRHRLPSFELRVLGPGDPEPWRAEAERQGLGGQIRFDGILPSGQPVLDWLDDVDVYVQPSFQEGLPRALVEAMSRACPAFGSTAGGIPELLPAECLHRPGDAARFADLAVQATNDPHWQSAQAERNFEIAKDYAREFLDQRRTEFWAEFARYAQHTRQGS